MANNIQLQEGHPVDENLRPIKIGGIATAIETAQMDDGAKVTGDLVVTGNISSDYVFANNVVIDHASTVENISIDTPESLNLSGDAQIFLDTDGDLLLDCGAGDYIRFREDGDTFANWYVNAGNTYFNLFESPGGTDKFTIAVFASGATYLSADDTGHAADVDFTADGSMVLKSYNWSGAVATEDATHDITLRAGGSVLIDKNWSKTTGKTLTALEVDFDKTAATTTDNTMYGATIDMDNTTATNGLNQMYGIVCTPTLTHAADAGTSLVNGIAITCTGNNAGSTHTSSNIGMHLTTTGADTNNGIVMTNDIAGKLYDIQIRNSDNVNDYFKILVEDNGVTTLSTEDQNSEVAHLTLDVDGDIKLDSHRGITKFYDAGDNSEYASLTVVGGSGATTLATLSDDATGHLTLDSDGDLAFDSGSGNFIAMKAGTEFSAADSAYAGMILGYTRISNDSTTTGHGFIEPDATMTVLQTIQGTDVSVTFKAPPSGNVEISLLCSMYGSSRTLEFALSDNATFNEVAETHTYDAGAQSSDETDINMVYVSFVNTGLTAGTEYTRWIGAAETISGTTNIRHGRNRTTGMHYPPIIVKAIALPSTITTGE